MKNIPAVAESRKHQENISEDVELLVKKTGLQPEVRPDFPTNSVDMSGAIQCTIRYMYTIDYIPGYTQYSIVW